MKTVKLCFDFLNGPIWKDVYSAKKDTLITGIEIIDNDDELQRINAAIQEKYSSFYIFNGENTSCHFDEEAFKAYSQELLSMMELLNKRLREINDGTYIVEDHITPSIQK